MRYPSALVLLAALCFVPWTSLPGDEPPPAPTAEQLEGWVRDLDSHQFALRDAASKNLRAAGGAAVDALAKAAASTSGEAARRALDVLKSFSQSDNDELKTKTIAALEKLAQSDDPRLARRAKQVLKPEADLPPMPEFEPGRRGRRMQIGNVQIVPGGQIQIGAQIQAGAGGVRTIQVRNANGKRTTTVQEAGKKIEIQDDPAGGIEMSVTEKVDGKEKTSKYAGKNLDELKKNHPEAAPIYEKYAGKNVLEGVQIQVHQIGAVPLPLGDGRREGGAAKQKTPAQLDEADKALSEAAEELKKLPTDSPANQAVKKALDQIERAREKLSEARKVLDRP
jgi:hypothetical protein